MWSHRDGEMIAVVTDRARRWVTTGLLEQKAEGSGLGPSRLSMPSSPAQNFAVHTAMRTELGDSWSSHQSLSCSERELFVGTADHAPISAIGIYSPLLQDQVQPAYGCIILAPSLFSPCLDQGSHTNFAYFFSHHHFSQTLGEPCIKGSFHRLSSKSSAHSLAAGTEPSADGLPSLPTSRAAAFFHRPMPGLLPLVVSSSSWSSAGDNQEGRCYLHRPASLGFLLLLKKTKLQEVQRKT